MISVCFKTKLKFVDFHKNVPSFESIVDLFNQDILTQYQIQKLFAIPNHIILIIKLKLNQSERSRYEH